MINIKALGLKGFIVDKNFVVFSFEWRGAECRYHNVVLKTLTGRNVLYCGVRLPWTMLGEDGTTLQINLMEYRDYHLVVFYSNYRLKWFHMTSQSQLKSSTFTYFLLRKHVKKTHLVTLCSKTCFYFGSKPQKGVTITLKQFAHLERGSYIFSTRRTTPAKGLSLLLFL